MSTANNHQESRATFTVQQSRDKAIIANSGWKFNANGANFEFSRDPQYSEKRRLKIDYDQLLLKY
jgi:hypothetical protein